jgi:hypothetical protein
MNIPQILPLLLFSRLISMPPRIPQASKYLVVCGLQGQSSKTQAAFGFSKLPTPSEATPIHGHIAEMRESDTEAKETVLDGESMMGRLTALPCPSLAMWGT